MLKATTRNDDNRRKRHGLLLNAETLPESYAQIVEGNEDKENLPVKGMSPLRVKREPLQPTKTQNAKADAATKARNRLSTLSIASRSSTTSSKSSNSFKSLAQKVANRMSLSTETDNKESHVVSLDTQLLPKQPQRRPSMATLTEEKTSGLSRIRESISIRSSMFRLRSGSVIASDNESISSNSTSTGRLHMPKSISIRKSLLSLNKESPALEKTMISRPVPQQASKDKLKNKLRHSSSLLSIVSYTPADGVPEEVLTVPVSQLESIQSSMLLRLCSQKEPLSFHDFFESKKNPKTYLEKLAEAGYSEVFVEKSKKTRKSLNVWKIIPFGKEEFEQPPIQNLIQELSITISVSKLPGFVHLKAAKVVTGKVPSKLTSLWDKWADRNGTMSQRPDTYHSSQQFLVMVQEYGGEDLEHFHIRSWRQASEIFWEVAKALKEAEDKIDFEHRDLHWGNILIKKRKKYATVSEFAQLSLDPQNQESDLQVSLIDYTLSRAKVSDRIVFTGLDSPNFFKGTKDYQFDIYRFMRQQVAKVSTPTLHSSGSFYSLRHSASNRSLAAAAAEEERINWSTSCPLTNILWLHYVADKLLHAKDLQPVNHIRRKLCSSSVGIEAADDGNELDFDNVEIESYKALQYIHRCLDPRKKKFSGARPKFKADVTMTRVSYSFSDFENMTDVLNWGRATGLY